MDIIPLGRFEEKLREDLEELRRHTRKNSWSDLLALWVARHFLKLDDNQLLRACGMQGPGEEGIDLFWVEQGGKRVIVGQAEAGVDLKLSKAFSRGIIDKLRRAVAALNDEELAENRQSPIANAIDDYNDAVAKGYSVEFWAIIGGIANKGLVRACNRFQKADLSKYPKHSLRVQDAAALLTQYCADVERLPYPDIALELPRKEHFRHGENSILATVSAKSVAMAVLDKGLHIFESNARLPILRSPINKEIAATLGDSGGQSTSGISITVSRFSAMTLAAPTRKLACKERKSSMGVRQRLPFSRTWTNSTRSKSCAESFVGSILCNLIAYDVRQIFRTQCMSATFGQGIVCRKCFKWASGGAAIFTSESVMSIRIA